MLSIMSIVRLNVILRKLVIAEEVDRMFEIAKSLCSCQVQE